MKYNVIVYGCQMNISDAERVSAVLEELEYKKTSNINEADLVVIVMCSVRQSAVDRIYGLVEKFKKSKRPPTIVLTGCILKRDKKRFLESFEHIIDIKDIKNLPKILKNQESKSQTDYFEITPKYAGKNSAFLPISNGCNNFCTYCVVPYTRGRLICRDHKKILEEAKDLINKRFKEIWLLGQNVNDYTSPSDNSINFPELLKMVNNLQGNFKIFFMSPNPKNFSDKLIKTMSECKKFSRYLNLPVQAGDDEILKKMNRPYTSEKYLALVKKIRKAIPDINLSTDVIVGFPGETKKQFENTAKLFKKIKYNIAYINKYSPRYGTAASKMDDDVPWAEKKRRERTLMDIINQK